MTSVITLPPHLRPARRTWTPLNKGGALLLHTDGRVEVLGTDRNVTRESVELIAAGLFPAP